MDFSEFDVRRYQTLSVTDGYREWVETYEDTVLDEMDVRLLARLHSIDWQATREVVELACGTGRIGAWLRASGVSSVDGVDLTPEMLAVAREKRVYRRLVEANVLATPLESGAYELAVQVLADEHLENLAPLYREVARLLGDVGCFVLIGYHPFFLMQGIPAHFDRPGGEPVAIESYVHLLSDHVKAAHAAGFSLVEMEEGIVDEAWLAKKPKWQVYRHRPVSFAMVWRR